MVLYGLASFEEKPRTVPIMGQELPERVKCYLAFNIDPSFLEETRPHVYKLALDQMTDRELNLGLHYTYADTVVIRFTRHGIR